MQQATVHSISSNFGPSKTSTGFYDLESAVWATITKVCRSLVQRGSMTRVEHPLSKQPASSVTRNLGLANTGSTIIDVGKHARPKFSVSLKKQDRLNLANISTLGVIAAPLQNAVRLPSFAQQGHELDRAAHVIGQLAAGNDWRHHLWVVFCSFDNGLDQGSPNYGPQSYFIRSAKPFCQ